MYELSNQELYKALEYAKSIDEENGRLILEKFQLDQTAFAQTIFGIFPAIISEQNQDMGNLFMDLCFDVICVYQHAFGETPVQGEMNQAWLEKQAELLNAELQAFIPEKMMNDKIRSNLQDRLTKRANEETVQSGLVNFMNDSIDAFASENSNRVSATKITQAMIFIVIRLFNNLYSQAE